MHPATRRRAWARGTSLIEAMIAMSVLLIGLGGFASLQALIVRANHFSKRMAQGSAMAADLAQNVKLWSYNDPRLAALATVKDLDAPAVKGNWDMGREEKAAVTAQFSEKAGDPNASNPGALATNYQGLSGDIDEDGQLDFIRYWNVYDTDLTNDGTPNGKLVQIIVRWKEPGYGFRQVTSVAFKLNPSAMLQ
jgi:hypothetical protein